MKGKTWPNLMQYSAIWQERLSKSTCKFCQNSRYTDQNSNWSASEYKSKCYLLRQVAWRSRLCDIQYAAGNGISSSGMCRLVEKDATLSDDRAASFYPTDGGNGFFQTWGTYLPSYTATHSWRQKSPCSSLWERHMLRNNGIVTKHHLIWIHSSCFHSVGTEVLIVFETLCARRGVCGGRSWLRHCSTSRKDAGSSPDGVIGIFLPSGLTMALGLTQPLTLRRADSVTTFICRLSWNPNLLEPSEDCFTFTRTRRSICSFRLLTLNRWRQWYILGTNDISLDCESIEHLMFLGLYKLISFVDIRDFTFKPSVWQPIY